MIPTFYARELGVLQALVLIACGCASSRTAPDHEPDPEPIEAEPSPFGGTSPLDSVAVSCAEGSAREIALDEVTEAGFSAEDLLANIEGMHEAPLTWASPEGVTIGPESGQHKLRVRVERASEGAALFDPDTDAIGHGARCTLWIAVDVVISLQSDERALNEEVQGTVYANNPSFAYFRAEAGSDDFGGELTVRSEAQLSRFELMMTLSEHGATGSLQGVWLKVEDGFSFEEPTELAYWGHAPCAVGEQSVRLDELVQLGDSDPVSATQAAEAARQHASLSITWQDGTRTTGTWSFAGGQNGACLGSDSFLEGGPLTRLAQHGVVELRTADGRARGQWPAYLTATGYSYEVSLDTIGMDDQLPASPAELGFPMQSLGELDALSVALNIRMVPPAEVSGELSLYGYDCGGGDITTVCDFMSVLLEAGTLGP